MSENQDLSRKSSKKPALGRGLGSLLGEASREVKPTAEAVVEKLSGNQDPALSQAFIETSTKDKAPSKVADHLRIWKIDIAKLKPNKRQPRQVFASEPLKELSQSVREKGILQPIVARPLMDGQFEIIAGERRWRAAQAAGLHEVPVILKSTPDQEALELALIENIQRENLNPIEEAEAYQHLMQTYAMTQQQLADKMGKDRATIANTLRLLALGKATRDLVARGQLSMGHAKVLLAVTDPHQQKQLAEKILSKKWSVRELEREVANLLKPQTSSVESNGAAAELSSKLVAGLSEELQKLLGTKVGIDYDKGRGKIAIHFYSDDELNGLVERLRESWRK